MGWVVRVVGLVGLLVGLVGLVVAWWWCPTYRASSKRTLTSFSESPLYLLTMLDAEMLKNVVRHSDATARASSVLPVPDGPTNSAPFGMSAPSLSYFVESLKNATISEQKVSKT